MPSQQQNGKILGLVGLGLFIVLLLAFSSSSSTNPSTPGGSNELLDDAQSQGSGLRNDGKKVYKDGDIVSYGKIEEQDKIPVALVEQHGEVLKYWLKALRRLPARERNNVFTVHIDSHSDYMDVLGTLKVVHKLESHRAELKEYLLKDPDIGDFITRAMFADKIQGVHWIRSDFATGWYNGPPPGHYVTKVTLDAETAGIDDDEDDEDDDDEDDEDDDEEGNEDTILCFTELEKVREWKGTLVNQNPIESVSECDKAVPGAEQEVQMIVSTLDSVMELPHETESWILDIDLDFFASVDPASALFKSFGFSPEWVEEYFQGVFQCPSNDDDAEVRELGKVMRTMAELIADIQPSTVSKLLRPSQCTVRQTDKLQKLIENLRKGSTLTLSRWKDLWKLNPLEWTGDFVSTLLSGKTSAWGPMGTPTTHEIAKTMKKLDKVIHDLNEKHGHPACITISRSGVYDHYLPIELAEFIQKNTFKLLADVFGEYLEGVTFDKDVLDKYRDTGGYVKVANDKI